MRRRDGVCAGGHGRDPVRAARTGRRHVRRPPRRGRCGAVGRGPLDAGAADARDGARSTCAPRRRARGGRGGAVGGPERRGRVTVQSTCAAMAGRTRRRAAHRAARDPAARRRASVARMPRAAIAVRGRGGAGARRAVGRRSCARRSRSRAGDGGAPGTGARRWRRVLKLSVFTALANQGPAYLSSWAVGQRAPLCSGCHPRQREGQQPPANVTRRQADGRAQRQNSTARPVQISLTPSRPVVPVQKRGSARPYRTTAIDSARCEAYCRRP